MSGQRLAVVLVAIVIVVVGAAIAVLGPPSEERARRLDSRRVDHLGQISQSAQLYFGRHKRLPTSIDEMAAEPGVRLDSRDPVSGAPYAYRVIDAKSYEVCADFDRPSEDAALEFWSHGAGRQCFTQKVTEPK